MNYNKNIYELIVEQELPDIASKGYLFKHKKSGARIAMISNDDENKVFSIGFRTPPADSTGVPHILEHSVLCGSDKYPAKDPFVELVKGSLNTFLNAMTYPDKTIYPVASCNDVDYKNLTDVYLDAVFHPNIYKKEQIFKQEGWHYELESVDGPLTYNGVVYNEMKGAFSSAEQRLYRICMNSLYPDTAYGTESGGDPEFIPDLSYEQFLGFHKKLYHPSNSYIFVYGNCDMEERLEYFDREYLCAYDAIDPDSDIQVQAPFDKPKRVEAAYSVTEEQGTENKTYLAYNASVGCGYDDKLSLTFNVLEYALFQAPGAPVRQALIDAGIGEDVSGYYEDSLLQPMVSITASNTNPDREEEFVRVIKDTLAGLVKDGINKKALKAGINHIEFSYREADYGRAPRGLMYGITMFSSWLYDESKPFNCVRKGETFRFLKEQLETDYFERIVEKYLLNNNHSAVVVLKPQIGLSAKLDEAAAKKLEAYKATLSREQLEAYVEDTKALKQYQAEPSTREELLSIPMLAREDISKESMPIYNTEKSVAGVKVLHHNINTNGIGYLRLSFSIDKVEDELLPYVGILSKVLGNIGTEKYSYGELSNEIDINTGGIRVGSSCAVLVEPKDGYRYAFDITGKALYENLDFLTETMEEIMNHSVLDDYKRLKEILGEAKTEQQYMLEAGGNSTGIAEIAAQMNERNAIKRQVSGLGYYHFIDEAYKNFEEKKEELAAGMKKAALKIFTRENLLVSYTADEKGYALMEDKLAAVINSLSDEKQESALRTLKFEKKRIGLKTGGQVDYVVRGGDYGKAGFDYTGTLAVLENAMNYDYLWINIRVKGGAYGCGATFGNCSSGMSAFYSYRDPNLAKTNEIYEQAVDYVKNFKADEREMTKYIIGTISGIDTPKNPAAKGAASFEAYVRGLTMDMINAQRQQILTAQEEDIQALAPIIEAVLNENYFCVVGSEEKINAAKDMFDVIENLL